MKFVYFKYRAGRSIGLLSVLLLFILAGAASAQYSYQRTQITPALPLAQPSYSEPNYNLRLGPMDFSVSVGVSGEWNDNIDLAPSGQELEDFIIRPFANVDGIWRLSDLNTLRLSVGLSYNYYLDNSQYDSESVIITPNTALSLVFFVGDVKVTLSDSFSYQEEPYSLPTISNQATFRRYENQAGIQLDYAATEELTLTAGYTHYNLWTNEEEFASLESSTDTFYLRPSYSVSPSIQVGLNASASYANYTESSRGNSQNYLFGPYVDFALSEYTSVNLAGGWQRNEFDNQLAAEDSTSSDSFYFRGTISNELNEYYSHYLTVSNFVEPGFDSNYYTSFRIIYGMDWRISPYFSLRPEIFYENYGSSAANGEEGERYGFDIGFGYRLTPSISVSAAYRYLAKDGNLPLSDYEQNSVRMSLVYEF